MYSELIDVNRTTVIEVNFTDVNNDISFIIFQVHSHIFNITVYNGTHQPMVVGTNVGLYSSVNPLDSFFIWNQHNVTDLNVLVSVHGYRSEGNKFVVLTNNIKLVFHQSIPA